MSLFDKQIVEEQKRKPFTMVLDKYKSVVIVNSIDVDEVDECLLIIDFDHDIDAPQEEVADELGRIILERLEKGMGYGPDDNIVEV